MTTGGTPTALPGRGTMRVLAHGAGPLPAASPPHSLGRTVATRYSALLSWSAAIGAAHGDPMIRGLFMSLRLWIESLPPTARAALRWDCASSLLWGAYNGCIWTFVARIARADLRASAADMAWISAAPALGYLFATIWARQMEGRAKMPFVWITWLVARGLFLLTPLFATRNGYVFLVCVTPIIFSVSTPAYTSLMKDVYPDHLRGRLMSLSRMCWSLSTFFFAFGAGRLLDGGLDWRWSFMFGGACGALSALAFCRIRVPLPDVEADDRMSTIGFVRDTLNILWRNPRFRWFSASVFVYGFGNIMAYTLYPIHQVDTFHIRNTDVANMQNLAAVTQIAGYLFWGGIMDRRGPLFAVLVGICIICLMPPCYAMAGNLAPIYLASAIGGLAFSGIELGYLNSILQLSEPGRAAQYQALHSSLYGIRGTIAPFCALPLMHVYGIRTGIWACGGVMLCGIGLQLVSMREHKRYLRRVEADRAVPSPTCADPAPTEAT